MKASIILLIVSCGLIKALIRDHVYVNVPMTWTDAQNHCRTYYTDLSTVASREEQDEIMRLAGGILQEKWIGLHRNKSNISQFLWSDGNSFSFSKWERGQPNNLNGNQHCVSFTYNWYDYECYKLFTSFCYKIKLTFVKENKTWAEALQYCRSHYSDLASMTTDRQLQLAKEVTVGSQTESVWTGLRYLAGEWFWVNNEPLGNQILLPVCPAQPSRCGARNTKTDKWENRDCAEKLNFLCN